MVPRKVDVEHAILALSTYLGHTAVACTYWYLTGIPELLAICAGDSSTLSSEARRAAMSKRSLLFSTLLQDFFCQRLINQRNASACTVAAYRDTFRLLLKYLEQHRKKQPVDVTMADLDAPAFWHSSTICKRHARTRFVAAIPVWPPCDPS